MYEILDHLPHTATVLDFCSGEGSFDSRRYPFRTICFDREIRGARLGNLFVEGEAIRLPFPSQSFDAVIANHALEHLDPLKPSLQELGRVLKKSGYAYVAVPDARRFSDRLYRKVFKNRGGHVNLFGDEHALVRMLSWYLGVPHAGTRPLWSSFAYLNRENFLGQPAKQDQLRIRPLPEWAVVTVNGALGLVDQWCGTALSLYGWALYFGRFAGGLNAEPAVNVCTRCGSSLPARAAEEKVRTGWILVCPYCGGRAVNRSRLWRDRIQGVRSE